MQAYQEEVTEYTYYDSDSGCGNWVRGVFDINRIYNFYDYNEEVEEGEFSLSNVPSREFAHCDECGDNYALDENPMTQFIPGDKVWVCGSCETWYVDEEAAVECCA